MKFLKIGVVIFSCAGITQAAQLGTLTRTNDVALTSDLDAAITNVASSNAFVTIINTNREIHLSIDASSFSTGGTIAVEADPMWTNAAAVGFSVGGNIDMTDHDLTNVRSIYMADAGFITTNAADATESNVIIRTDGTVSIRSTNNYGDLTVGGTLYAPVVTGAFYYGYGGYLTGLMEHVVFTGDVYGAWTNLQITKDSVDSNALDVVFLDARYASALSVTGLLASTVFSSATNALWAAIRTNYEGIVYFTNVYYTAQTTTVAIVANLSNRVTVLESTESATGKVAVSTYAPATNKLWGAIATNRTYITANSNAITALRGATGDLWTAMGAATGDLWTGIGAASNALRADIEYLQDSGIQTTRFDRLYVADITELGAEMVINGAFTNVSDWTITGGNIMSERVVVSYDTCVISPITPLSLGTAGVYVVSLDFSTSVGSCDIMLGGMEQSIPGLGAGTDTKQIYVSVPGSNLAIRVTATNGMQTIDNVSVRQVTNGNMWVAGDLRVQGSVYGTAAISEADPVWSAASNLYMRVGEYGAVSSVVLTNTPIADSLMLAYTNSKSNWDVSFLHSDWSGYAAWNNGIVFSAIDGPLHDIHHIAYTGSSSVVAGNIYRWDAQFEATNAVRSYTCSMGSYVVDIVPTNVTEHLYFYAITTNGPYIEVENFTETTALTNLKIYTLSPIGNLYVSGSIYNTNIVTANDAQAISGAKTFTGAMTVSNKTVFGVRCKADGAYCSVGGGYNNHAAGGYSSIGGGFYNQLDSQYSFVGGGYMNIVSGDYSAVAGGQQNFAGKNFSFAAGKLAKATNVGAFVWGDSFYSTSKGSMGDDTFNVYAQGGSYFIGGPIYGDGSELSNIFANASSLNGYDVSTNAPAESEILQYVGGEWTPSEITNLQASVTNEADPDFHTWLGTNEYIKTETDPVFTNWLDTNTMLSGETDPVFTNWLETNATINAAAWSGYAATDTVNMAGNSLTNAGSISTTNIYLYDPDADDYVEIAVDAYGNFTFDGGTFATGTPVYSLADWAGSKATTNIDVDSYSIRNVKQLVFTNSQYVRGIGIDTVTGFITGAYLNASLLGGLAAGSYATGSPVYADAETINFTGDHAEFQGTVDIDNDLTISGSVLIDQDLTVEEDINLNGNSVTNVSGVLFVGGGTITGTPVYAESDPAFTNWLATNSASSSLSGTFEPSISITGQSYSSIETVSGIYQRVGNVVNASFKFNVYNVNGEADCYVALPSDSLDTAVSWDAKINTHFEDKTYSGSLPATNSFGTNLFEITDVVFTSIEKNRAVIPTNQCILRVTSPNPDGVYFSGDTITVYVVFSDPVYTVLGTPVIGLEMDGTNRNAFYTNSILLPSDTLAFNYVVGPYDATWDLDYSASNSLAGGGILDEHMWALDTWLPTPGDDGSLSANKSFSVNRPDYNIYNISAKEDGYYYTGDTVTVQVVYRTNVVTVGGTPFLFLDLENREVRTEITGSYLTNGILEFEYIVQSGDKAYDLNYIGTNPLVHTNGTVWGAGWEVLSGLGATNSYPPTNSVMSLGGSSEVHINYPKKYSTFECMYKVED
ncbi:MAG: hypothetical protein EOM20_10460 [Spartobacteria bacterium]|nr:hypothetical protein [Spartobacteria bacterium]